MIKRRRTHEFAPLNSGSAQRPERINVRCTTEECGRMLALLTALKVIKRRDPSEPIADTVHHVLIPAVEKLVRALRFGSSAEQASASVYFEERVRREDYVRNRHLRYQPSLKGF